jgi:ribonuclease D
VSERAIETIPPWRFISRAEEMREALESLKGERVLGVDTETYWDPSTKRMLVSLAQISPTEGEVLVCDVLNEGVEALRDLIESPDIWMIAHNARFDDGVLRAAGLQPQGFIDTLQLSRRLLSLSSYSLASVSEHLFAQPLDKTLRTSNWRRRPLTKSQIAYAALDARVTLRVFEELRRVCEERGIWDEASRAAMLSSDATPKRTARRSKPLPDWQLTEDERRVFQALKKWRLEQARLARVPAYMICSDKTLEHLARERPATLESLSTIYGLGESKIARFGEAALNALKEAAGDDGGN